MSRLALLSLVLLVSGCGTIIDAGNFADSDRRFDSPGPHLYGGLRVDALLVADPGDKAAPFVILFLLDVPFSLALDTVFLPFTIPWAIFGPK